MGARTEQKEQTKRLVLDTAYALFEQKGYAATTMRELAARAGIAPGSIFSHFPDKRSLVVAAFQQDVNRAVEAAWASLPDGPLVAQLKHLVRQLYAFYAERPGVSRVLIEQSLFVRGDCRETMDGMVLELLTRVANLYATAAERGELAARDDWMPAALGFWSDYFLGLVLCLRQTEPAVEAHVTLVGQLLADRLQGLEVSRPSGDSTNHHP